MSRSHSSSLYRVDQERKGAFKGCYPNVAAVSALADDFVVTGNLRRRHPTKLNAEGVPAVVDVPLDSRWCTVSKGLIAEALGIAERDGTLHACRIPNRISGNQYGWGSEPGVFLQLTGSPEAKAIAKKLHIDYRVQMTLGRGITAEYANGLSLYSNVYEELHGLKLPGLPKEEVRESRMDTSNPTFDQAIAVFDQTGLLPARERIARGGPSYQESIVGFDEVLEDQPLEAGLL